MKKYVKNKKIGAFLVAMPFLTVAATSCDDWFTILPQSEMVADDFWIDGQDVESAIGGCYTGMQDDGFMRRLIVWGELRSDNVINGPGSDTEISYILNANLNEANSYCDWSAFYTVINRCNNVIQNAPAVRERDADFTQADLNQYLAEAKAIRAFCYFTLVRTFNDVPYTEEPYTDDTRTFYLAQTSCEQILDTLIRDLESVEDMALVENTENIEYTRGRITQKAIWALMADIYLWMEDYAHCVEYCDKILNTSTNPLSLLPADSYFNSVFYVGNSDESIWELQFDSNTSNSAVNTFYGGSGNSTPLLTSLAFDSQNGADWWGELDMRRIGSYVENNGMYYIMKYVAACYSNDYNNVSYNNFSYGSSTNNWIIYRLADAYLMKAEALAEQGDLTGAVEMVSYTYDRAHPDLDEGSLVGQYNTQSAVRDLVFDERQREFLFEGKRYFDLVRRMRRDGSVSEIISNYILRKYLAMSLSQNTILSKINDRDAIYMPVYETELRLNPLLEQNRFYETSEDISRN